MRVVPKAKVRGERTRPLTLPEIDGLAARAFGGCKSAVLAVSGGADSMILLLLAKAWRNAGHSTPFIVATVDHGLRPESADEALWVGEQARAAGFAHRVLRWDGAKPRAGIQEAAREARYDLLASAAVSEGLPLPIAIVMGHHLDDQAETFLMRLQRGSGLDGLSAMPEVREMPGFDGVVLIRPLLSIPKARLVATLQSCGLGWVEDPSNQNPMFERVRLRKALVELEHLGITAAEIGLAARRLARARNALDGAAGDLIRCHAEPHAGACAVISAKAFDEAGEELQLRLVQRFIGMFGAPGERPRMAALEELAVGMASGSGAWTLAGCRLRRGSDSIQAMREHGRRGLPSIELAAGESRLWDGRFRVSASSALPRPLQVRALTPGELASLRRAQTGTPIEVPAGLPRAALLTLPSFWEGDRLLGGCHPALGPAFPGALEGVQAEFVHACAFGVRGLD